MRKNSFIYSLASALMMGALAVSGLTACSSSNDTIEEKTPEAKKLYHVRIHATMNDDAETRAVEFDNSSTPPTSSSTFKTTERIYIYNKTKSAWLIGEWDETNECYKGFLKPNEDGKSCELEGDIEGTIDVGDELVLTYNINEVAPDLYLFNYTMQDGTETGVLDGAVATVKVKAIDNGDITFCQKNEETSSANTDPTAHFESVQSMFRFKFIDTGNSDINLKSLKISSQNSAIASYYNPITNIYDKDKIIVNLDEPTSNYIYVALSFDESINTDKLIFTAIDNGGKIYQGTKAAPSGGFKNSKYYYNSSAIQLVWLDNLQEPTIEWTSVADDNSGEPNDHYYYSVKGPSNSSSEFKISGSSKGYWFMINGASTVTLDGLTANYWDDDNFLHSDGNLNLVINGSNTIASERSNECIYTEGTLKLSGEGTLYVVASEAEFCGIWADNYNTDNSTNSYETTTEVDVSDALAAEGYTVIRSARGSTLSGNAYTWTYTVTSNKPNITWTNVYNGTVEPDANNKYTVYCPNNTTPAEFTISNISKGYSFDVQGEGSVTLNGLTATYSGVDEFLQSTKHLTLEISGTNTITCANNAQCIFADGSQNSITANLKLKGEGTLTVTSKDATLCGLKASNYNNSVNLDNEIINRYEAKGYCDVTDLLAADGYSVVRGPRQNNDDGTYTWTYYVTQLSSTLTITTGGETTYSLTYNKYEVYGKSNGEGTPSFEPSEITISGTSDGYWFDLNWGSSVTLNGLTATRFGDQFIYGSDMEYTVGGTTTILDLNLVINGTNTITCKGANACIYSAGNLKLRGNGTLTVTCSSYDTCGLEAIGNYLYDDNTNNWQTTTEVDVSTAIAATGYKVTRSARTTNANGSYTWTYTVAPNP